MTPDHESTSYNQSAQEVIAIKNTGLASLAAYRAELYLLQRKILENVGEQCNLEIVPKMENKQYACNPHENTVNNDDHKDSSQNFYSVSAAQRRAGLENHHLSAAVLSVENSRNLYQVSDRGLNRI